MTEDIPGALAKAWPHDPIEGEHRIDRPDEFPRLVATEMQASLHGSSSRAFPLSPLAEQVPFPHRLGRLLSRVVPNHVRLHFDMIDFPAQAQAHEDALLRVCQQAVFHAVRNAAPTVIHVKALPSQSRIRLTIIDNGSGTATPTLYDMGLSNIDARLSELGGRLRVAPRLPRGTQVLASLPRRDRTNP